MSERGTLNFYFKRKENVVEEERPVSSSIPLFAIENVSSQTLPLTDSIISFATSTSLPSTISDDVNKNSISNRSRSIDHMKTIEPFKRDPCRGPSFAKEFILLGPYQPKCHHPIVNYRRFCSEWFQTYKWLEYSETNGNAYCFVCRFAYDPIKTDQAFTVVGFNNWKHGVYRLDKHQSTVSHKQANETWLKAKQNRLHNESVLKQIDRRFDKQFEDNRLYLNEIVRTILFLAKQGLAFRGHREDDESENRGNFLELLELRSLDNEIIRKNLQSLKYTDYKIQNEILMLIQDNITKQIIFHIKKSKYFSVMIDETSDVSRHEQVSLVIRYVDDLFNVYERFIGFERTFGTSGEDLFNLLVSWIQKLGLDVQNIIGQCYDGASSMRGEYKGVAARLQRLSPKAIYIHCNSHVLNLSLVDVSTAVKSIRNNFGVVQALYNLIESSAKRHHVFEDVQKQVGLKPLVMKKLCETRWTCRFECLTVIVARYPKILEALHTLDNGVGLIMLNTVKTFDFVFHLLIMNEIYLTTNILSKYLQHSDISLTNALIQVKLTNETLKTWRTESKFEEFWNKATDVCEANDIDGPEEVRRRKIPAKSGAGSVIPDDFSAKDNYRVNSYYAVLDCITMAIENRFDENHIGIIVVCEKLFLSKDFLSSNELQQVATFYQLKYDDLRAEQSLYKTGITNQQEMSLKSVTKFFLRNNFHLVLPAMNELLTILWTIPVHVCECERSFSSLKRLKTYLRNTMGQERLSALALINIESTITIDISEVVSDFISKNETRKRLFSI